MDVRASERIWWACMAAFVVLFGWTASALAGSPRDHVEEKTEAVAAVLAKPDSSVRTQELAEVVEESLDLEYLASRALGDHWTQRSPAEREEFMSLLQRLLQGNYEDRLAGRKMGDDYEVDFEQAQVRGERAFVAATVTKDDTEKSLVYRLRRDGESWKIYDLVIDDISLEETYRDGYVPIIEEQGWEELIRRMEERLEELEGRSD